MLRDRREPPTIVSKNGRVIERAHSNLDEAQYFAFCDAHAEERYELIDGLLWPHPDYRPTTTSFAAPTRGHQAIVRNLIRALELGLPSSRRAENNVALRVRSVHATFRQPDVVLTCGAFDANARYVEDPIAIVEVLSESTAAVDLLDKPREYAAIESLEIYIVVDSRPRNVIVYERANGFQARQCIDVAEIARVALSIEAIYAGVL